MADSNALVRLEQSASQAITEPKALAAKIREWQSMAHVLTPAVHVSALAPQHAIAPALVVLDTRVDDQGVGVDVYHSKLFHRSSDERSLTKVALNKLSSAAGASITTKRTDDRAIPNYWEMQARVTYTDFDGTPRAIERTAEMDLRDGSAQLNGMKPGQIQQARRFGLRLCEAKACNAAARDAWGIPSKYTVADLQKPFVALRVSFVPDMSDPMQRQIVAERALSGSAALYPSRRALPDADVIDVQPEPEREPSSAAQTATPASGGAPLSQAGTSTATEPGAPTSDPLEPTGPTIVEVKTQDGKTRDKVDAQGNVIAKGGRPFTRHFITLSDGRELHTFNTDIGKLAAKLMEQKRPIEVETEDSKFGINIVELKPAEPKLPLDDGPTDADLKL